MDKRNSLIKKYLEGETSLSEEEQLFNDSNLKDPGIASWKQYVQHHKKKAPKDFNNSIWEEKQFEARSKSQKYIYLIAIVLLLSILGIIVTQAKKSESLDYASKKELLEQAIAMTAPDSELSEQNHIIYEDDVLIIFVPKP